jgi:hypothetical protein
MATLDDCRAAIETLADRLAQADDVRENALDRTLSCRVPDLDVTFSGRLQDGHIRDVTTAPADKAQIRLTVSSDDLVALTDGSLSIGSAFATGKLKIDASFLDLLKLRSLL